MPSTVQLQVEVIEKNAEARLKALDNLAKEMGNRKITLNFDASSLAAWKAATDSMSAAQINAYAKMAVAAENTAQAEINAANRVQAAVVSAEAKKEAEAQKANAKIVASTEKTTQEQIKAETKLATERQKSFDKKIQLYHQEDTKRRAIAAKTEQTEISANARAANSQRQAANATREHAAAQNELGSAASKTSSIFDSLTARFSAANIVSYLVTAAISRIRRSIREAIEEMKEMDKELTTIKMVSGASDSEISNLRDQAYSGARSNGRKATEYLSAAEMFTRAGYRDNIDQLSELSLMTQNIGGVEEEVAGKFLLAADAAWKLGGNYEALMGILDGVSAVADQNATDLGKIAEGITVAGSAFANAGESAQTFTAMLGVTTASTQRSGSEMARGLRTILFRVRQVKAEFDDGEIVDAKAISNAAKALEDVGISVIDETGDLKSMSQILTELSGKWGNLSKAQQSYLQNYLAGNRNGNVLFALMDNWEVYEKMLQQYEDSAGTALEKNAIYTESWAAATNNLNTSWTSLMSTLTGSGSIIQGFVKELTDGLDILNGIVSMFKDFDTATSPEVLENVLAEIKANPDQYKGIFGFDHLLGLVFREMSDAVTEAEKSSKAASKASDGIKDYSDKVEGAGDSAEEASAGVEKLTNAFERQRNVISEVAKAIKAEKNDAVDSLSDIYKSMNEAAEKGMWGSNAFRKGGALFFSEEVLEDIRNGRNNPLKDAMDAYIEGVNNGDYSDAAAGFFGAVTKGANEIKAENGEVLASMKDVGDAYEWTFEKGNRSMEEYLQSLQNNTGISKTFWASMIESLGLYSDELAEWTEDNSETETKANLDTEEGQKELKEWTDLLDSVPEEVQTKLRAVYEKDGLEAAENELVEEAAREQAVEDAITMAEIPAAVAKSMWDAAFGDIAEFAHEAAEKARTNGQEAGDAYAEGFTEGAKEAKTRSGNFDKLFSENDDQWIVRENRVAGKEAGDAYAEGFAENPPKVAVDDTAAKTAIADLVKPETKIITVEMTTGTIGRNFNYYSFTGGAGAGGSHGTYIAAHAGGKRDNYSGIAIVNDEFPADGSKPELIISKSRGMAYIANGGRPALVNLASDDVVLTARETKSAMGVPGFVTGKTPKGNGANNPGTGGPGKAEEVDPTDNWNQLKKLIDYMLDKEKETLDDKLAILDEQLEELEAARKSQKNLDTLAQKLVRVDEAQLDLLKAQTERTVRYYNESTQQWEWMADQGALAKAEEAYSDALKELNDFLIDLDFEEQKANIKAQKEALQDAFDAYKEGWDRIIDSIEAPTGDLAELFAELKTNGTEAMQTQADNISALLDALEKGFYKGIEDNALASQNTLADMYATLDKATQDSLATAQEAINNILGRSTDASTDAANAAASAMESLSTTSSNAVTELMEKAKAALSSMTEDTSSTSTSAAGSLSSAAQSISGEAASAIQNVVANANDFLNKVKGTDDNKTTDSKSSSTNKSTSKSGGGGKNSTAGNAAAIGAAIATKVIGESNGKNTAITTAGRGGRQGTTLALGRLAVDQFVTKGLKTSASTINNNGGNTYINGMRVGSDQLDNSLRNILKGMAIMKQ